MLNMTARGLALLIPGIILTGYGFIKAAIIGYYPSEAVPTFLALGAGAALLWASNRFGRNDSANEVPISKDAE